MMDEVSGKVIVVTGTGAGMGRATALLLGSRGAKVIAADISGGEEETAKQIGEFGVPVHCDVRDEGQVEKLLKTAIDRFGRLDAVLNVAGFGIPSMLADADMADFDRMFDVDLKGVVHGTKHAIRAMSDFGGGVILNWSSNAFMGAAPMWGMYSAAKAGVISITKAAAVEYGPMGIRANVIAPGTISTEGVAGMPPQMAEAELAKIPAGRFGEMNEVAELASFLVSDRAAFINGAVIVIDGGKTAQLP
ncbi:MAG: SDR family NAD(P)-dependent oxidoreductase [Novosphingobium sp.]